MKVLITGISGQDGIFLTNKLLESHQNITIYGTSRNYNEKKFLKNLESVSNSEKFTDVIVKNINLLDSNSVENMVDEIRPDLLFNLSGPSSVYESLKNPNIKEINYDKREAEKLLYCLFYSHSLSNKLAIHDNWGICGNPMS